MVKTSGKMKKDSRAATDSHRHNSGQQATNSADQTDQEKKTDAETDQEDQEQQQATMTDTVPEGALDTDADGNAPTYDADGNQVGTATPEEIAKAEEMITDTIDGVPAVRITGKIRRVFNGSIRIRNAPSWDNEAVRGAAAFTEKEVTHVMEVDGQPMYKTLDGYFVSGDRSWLNISKNNVDNFGVKESKTDNAPPCFYFTHIEDNCVNNHNILIVL